MTDKHPTSRLSKPYHDLHNHDLGQRSSTEIMCPVTFNRTTNPLAVFENPSDQMDGDSKWMDLEKAMGKGRGHGGPMVWCEERLTVQRGLRDNSAD